MPINSPNDKLNRDAKGRFVKGHSLGLRFGKGQRTYNGSHGYHTGEKSVQWKGEKIGYRALHIWLECWLGKPKECVYCGSEKNVQWASLSHKAKRDLKDYLPLCAKCHHRYDNISKKAWETRRRNGTDRKLVQI
jgi:hypothetical protein